MAMKNQPNTNSSASVHNLTYQKGHMNSMTDALKEIRKSKKNKKIITKVFIGVLVVELSTGLPTSPRLVVIYFL